METFDFDFRPVRPGPPLDVWIEQVWYARGTVPYTRERIAPTGSTVAVLVLGDDPIRYTPDDGRGARVDDPGGYLVGPHDRPGVNEPTGETHAVGIVTTPVGCEAVFGRRPATIRGRASVLSTVWPPVAGLREALRGIEDPDAVLARLLAVVGEGVEATTGGEVPAAVARVRQAVGLLEADPVRSIPSVADEVEVSHAHLIREMTRIVGLTPRVLARLLRMRRLLDGLDVTAEVPWAGIAADLGWADQSHLIRDFTRHTGVTPTAYLEAQRTWYAETADPAGFVPER